VSSEHDRKKKHRDILGGMLHRITVYDRGIMLVTGLIGLACFTIAYLTLAVHADRIVAWAGEGGGLSAYTRVLIMGVLIALLGLGVTLFGIFFFRRTRTIAMARRIERKHPGFRHTLVTYLEICRRGAHSNNERVVARAVGKRAAKRLARVDPSDMANTDLLIRVAAMTIACCAIAFISAIVSWNSFSASFERIVWPSSQRRPPTSTRIAADVVPGDVKVLRHSDVTFETGISGTVPEKAWLVWSGKDGDGRAFARPPSGRDAWSWTRRAVEGDFDYHIEAGDDRSETHHVDVVEVPIITDVGVRQEYPAYMNLGSRTDPGGQITTFVGTQVTVTAKTNKPVKAAGAEPVARNVLVDPDGRSFVARFVVQSNGSYRLWFRDTDGFRNPQPVTYSIVASADEPPDVRITEPGKDVELAPDDVLSLVVRAEDKFGLTDLKVMVELRGLTRTIKLPKPQEPSVIERVTLSMPSIGAGPGDRIRYWAVARDNMPARPNIGTSQDYFVTIRAPGAEVVEVAALDQEEIAEIADEPDPFEELVERLRNLPEDEPEPAPTDAEDALAKLAEEGERLNKDIVEAVDEAAKADELDRRERELLAERLDQLADRLEDVVREAEEVAMAEPLPPDEAEAEPEEDAKPDDGGQAEAEQDEPPGAEPAQPEPGVEPDAGGQGEQHPPAAPDAPEQGAAERAAQNQGDPGQEQAGEPRPDQQLGGEQQGAQDPGQQLAQQPDAEQKPPGQQPAKPEPGQEQGEQDPGQQQPKAGEQEAQDRAGQQPEDGEDVAQKQDAKDGEQPEQPGQGDAPKQDRPEQGAEDQAAKKEDEPQAGQPQAPQPAEPQPLIPEGKELPPKVVSGPQEPSENPSGDPDGGPGTKGGGSNTGAGSSKKPSPSNLNKNNTIGPGQNLGKATLTADQNGQPQSKGPSGGTGTEVTPEAAEALRKGELVLKPDDNPEAKGMGGLSGGPSDELGARGPEGLPPGQGEQPGQVEGEKPGQGQGEQPGQGQGEKPGKGAGSSPVGAGGRGKGAPGAAAARSKLDRQVDALRAKVGEALKLIESLNEVSDNVRRGKVSPDLLARFNLPEAPRGKGGEAFDRGETADAKLGVRTRDKEDERDESGEPDAGRTQDIHDTGEKPDIVDKAEIRSGDLTADQVRRLVESGKIDVSPEYRRLVERYFAELSEK